LLTKIKDKQTFLCVIPQYFKARHIVAIETDFPILNVILAAISSKYKSGTSLIN
jgi:hypothetical protein